MKNESAATPRHLIFIPSRGRADVATTPRWLDKEGIPFRLVVERKEVEDYTRVFGKDRVLGLPGSDYGNVSFARNWIRDHSRKSGAERHWQLDDNINGIRRVNKGHTKITKPAPVFALVEDFAERYSNIGVTGIRHIAFCCTQTKPFLINQQVYSCMLVENSHAIRWRIGDTDYSIQILVAGLCTVLICAFAICKAPSMKMKGGNTDTLYAGQGRLKFVRALQRFWPNFPIEASWKHNSVRIESKQVWRLFTQTLKAK